MASIFSFNLHKIYRNKINNNKQKLKKFENRGQYLKNQ